MCPQALPRLSYLSHTASQGRIREGLLKLLKIDSSNVSENTVRFLGSIVRKFEPLHVSALMTDLVKSLVDTKTPEKDIELYEIAIKKSIRELRHEDGRDAGGRIVFHLSKGLQSSTVHLQIVSMDLLKDILSRFGRVVAAHHEKLIQRLQTKLEENVVADVPVKAADTLGSLVPFIEEHLFVRLMEHLIKCIAASGASSINYIYAIGVISREVGVRVGSFLKELIPLLQAHCNPGALAAPLEDDMTRDVAIGRFDACFTAFESILRGCPEKLNDHFRALLDTIFAGMRFDPNMARDSVRSSQDTDEVHVDNDDDNDDDEWEDDQGEEWGYDDGDDMDTMNASGEVKNEGLGHTDADMGWGVEGQGPTDDEDISWKVRRQATLCLEAFIVKLSNKMSISHHDEVPISDAISTFLLSRLHERDESVRVLIYNCLRFLIQESVVDGDGNKTDGGSETEKMGDIAPSPASPISSHTHSPSPDSSTQQPRLRSLRLRRQRSWGVETNDVLTAIDREFKHSSAQTKVAIIELLQQMVRTNGRSQDPPFRVDLVFPHALAGAETVGLTLESLRLLRLIMETVKNPRLYTSFQQQILSVAVRGMDASQAPIKIMAMRVSRSFAECIDVKETKVVLMKLFAPILRVLKVRDMDKGVKDAAMAAAAVVATRLSKIIPSVGESLCPILVSRLRNESTRRAAVKALRTIADAGDVNLRPVLQDLVMIVTDLIQHSQSPGDIRVLSVRALAALIRRYATYIKGYDALLIRLLRHASDTDAAMCAVVMRILADSISKSADTTGPKLSLDVVQHALQRALELAKSSALQGHALSALKHTFRKLSSVFSFEQLTHHLRSLSRPDMPDHSCGVMAQCMAAVAGETDRKTVSGFVRHAIQTVTDTETPSHVKRWCNLCIGELGKNTDVSGLADGVDTAMLAQFSDSDPVVRASASRALGSVTAGSLGQFLQPLIRRMDKKPLFSHLLLNSLREVLLAYRPSGQHDRIRPYTGDILRVLMTYTDSTDSGTRTMTAVCLGYLAHITPTSVIQTLRAGLRSKQALTRAVVVAALRVGLSDATMTLVSHHIPGFAAAMRDKDINVREKSVVLVDTVLSRTRVLFDAKHKVLLRDTLIPSLLAETALDKRYLREVDVGSFKIKEDNHLPLRIATYRALATLIRVAPERVDMTAFYAHWMMGILDMNQDIVGLTWSLIAEIARSKTRASLSILAQVESARPVKDAKITFEKLLLQFVVGKIRLLKKGDSKEQSTLALDVAKELLKASLKAVLSMMAVPEVRQCRKFMHAAGRVQSTVSLEPLFEEVKMQMRKEAE